MRERDDERPLGDLFAQLTGQMTTLVRQEIDLARTEMTAKAATAGRSAGLIGAGGVIVHAGFLALVFAAIVLLASFGLDLWLSAVAIGVVLAGLGLALIISGRDRLSRLSVAPQRTIRTLKEDAEWASDRTK
jgi:uncharacterized protein YacL